MNSKTIVSSLIYGFIFGAIIQLLITVNPYVVSANELPVDTEVGVEATSEPVDKNTNSFVPTQESMFEATDDPLDPGLPEVSTDDISNWVDRKGFEIVGILQRFVQPFAIIIMIGCAFMTMVGAFGNPRLLSGGILGMMISMIVYVVVLYAPEIMDIFLNWVRT